MAKAEPASRGKVADAARLPRQPTTLPHANHKETGADKVVKGEAADSAPWSEPTNGLRARLALRRSAVVNGTPILTTYLELQNVSDVSNPMKIAWRRNGMVFRVVDADGSELSKAMGPYSGHVFPGQDLVLPYDSTMSFSISCSGLGIPADKAALIDLGGSINWIIEDDEKDYYMEASFQIPQSKRKLDDPTRPWHGRIELPRIQIPLKAPRLNHASIGELIEELGIQMLGKDAAASVRAARSLSMVEDERVIPWYLKAMDTNSYSLKFRALDRLAMFKSDEAFRGLKKAMATQGPDIGNCTTEALAAGSASNIRHAAAGALSRSQHPDAKRLLLSMWNDPYDGVRITVLHALGKMDSEESLELLRRMAKDADETVRNEAKRYLKLRYEPRSSLPLSPSPSAEPICTATARSGPRATGRLPPGTPHHRACP